MTEQDDPSVVSTVVSNMRNRAAVCNALMSGTLGMRSHGTTYLPQEPAESNDAYGSRLAKTVLFPAYEKAVNTMMGKPFGEPIELEDDVPKAIKDCCENIDLSGRDLDTFAADVFTHTMSDGIGWIVADCPRVGEGLTLADERAIGFRPYLIHVPLANVLGWKHVVESGVHKLTQFRYLECTEIEDGKFGTKEVEQVRVLEPGEVTVYRKDERGKWQVVPEMSGPVTLQEMPVATVILARLGWMVAKPPLENMAWLNVEHWQSRSDQRNILHVARVPLLFGKGLATDANGNIVIGANTLLRSDTPDGDLKWVELMGGSIEAGRQDLLDIEDAMRRTAGELIATEVQKTATETQREAGEGESQLVKWVKSFEDSLEEAFRLMAAWINLPSGGGISINTEWDNHELGADIWAALTNLRNTGNMSLDTMLWNIQQAGKLPPERTVEEEKALIQNEAPSPGGAMSKDPLMSAMERLKARAQDGNTPPAPGNADPLANGQDGGTK